MKKLPKPFLYPAALAVIFMASVIIIVSPVGSKTIIPLYTKSVSSFNSQSALDTIEKLPEVVKENQLLLAKKVKTTLYIEAEPSATDPNFHIYYGELQLDHENRLVAFLVDSKTGKISIDTIIDPSPVSYEVWKNSCQLEACQK